MGAASSSCCIITYFILSKELKLRVEQRKQINNLNAHVIDTQPAEPPGQHKGPRKRTSAALAPKDRLHFHCRAVKPRGRAGLRQSRAAGWRLGRPVPSSQISGRPSHAGGGRLATAKPQRKCSLGQPSLPPHRLRGLLCPRLSSWFFLRAFCK